MRRKERVGLAYTVTYENLPQGIRGTHRTLAVMASAVRGELPPDYCGFRSESIRQSALSMCVGLQGHDSVGEIMALFFFVRDRIRYRYDPIDTERVQDAATTLALQSGDCDDKCVLLASLLASLGHWPQFVAQSQDGREFDHVYVEAWCNGEWLALDPTADGWHGMHLAQIDWRNPAKQEWIYKIFD